jgi:hypothetical protein
MPQQLEEVSSETQRQHGRGRITTRIATNVCFLLLLLLLLLHRVCDMDVSETESCGSTMLECVFFEDDTVIIVLTPYLSTAAALHQHLRLTEEDLIVPPAAKSSSFSKYLTRTFQDLRKREKLQHKKSSIGLNKRILFR